MGEKTIGLGGGISGQGRDLREGRMRPDEEEMMNTMSYGDQLDH